MARNDEGKTLRNIGRRIGEIRVQKGLSQAQLAEKIGMSVRQLQRFETGVAKDTALTVKVLVRIANALDVDYGELHKKAKTAPPGRGRPKRKRAGI